MPSVKSADRRRRNLTIAEAAEHLNVSDKTIRKWVAAGKLRAYRLNGKVLRFDLDDLEGFRTPATK